jgi:hypothetical protein
MKERKLEEPAQTCRMFRMSLESPIEFEGLRRAKQHEVGEEWKAWLESCHESADLLLKAKTEADLWFRV